MDWLSYNPSEYFTKRANYYQFIIIGLNHRELKRILLGQAHKSTGRGSTKPVDSIVSRILKMMK